MPAKIPNFPRKLPPHWSICLYLTFIYCFLFITLETRAAESSSSAASVSATVPAPPLVDVDAPTPPILTWPTDGTITNNQKIEFGWRQSTDPNGNPVSYTLYLNGVATYLGISNSGNSLRPNYTARIESGIVRLTPTVIIPDGVYTWKVVAYDSNSNEASSTTWNLTIDSTPPFLTITEIDSHRNIYLSTLDPSSVPEGTTFTAFGPKNIDFKTETEPFATVELSFFRPDNSHYLTIQEVSNNQGHAPIRAFLPTGRYRVESMGFDRAGNVAILPAFELIINERKVTIPGIPGITEPLTFTIPPSLPATIAALAPPLILPYYLLLAVILFVILLIILWKRRYNLLLIDSRGNPITSARIFHSKPDTKWRNSLLVTRREPSSFQLEKGDQGKIWIPRLNRYSTLTIKIKNATFVLSVTRFPHSGPLILNF